MKEFPKVNVAILVGVVSFALIVYACASAAAITETPTPTVQTAASATPASATPTPADESTPVPTAEATITEAPTETEEPTAGAGANVIATSDQSLSGGNVLVVDHVTAAADGWIVIHADDNGQPGAVVGYAPVNAGENDAIQVTITDPTAPTPTLYAMLHVDAGTAGVYEFPGPDEPVKDETGATVMAAFRVL